MRKKRKRIIIMIDNQYQTYIGRKLVAFTYFNDWAKARWSNKERRFDVGPIVEAWPVNEDSAYEEVVLEPKIQEEVKKLLMQRFMKQKKSPSFIKDFFSEKGLTDEEKEEIDRTHVRNEKKPEEMYIISDDYEVQAPTVHKPTDKNTKKELVIWLTNEGVPASLDETKAELLAKVALV